MKNFYNRFRHWIFAVILFPVGACVTPRGVDRYLSKHPESRAKIVENGIRVDTFRSTEYTPGPEILVDCDSAIKSASYQWQTIGGQTVYIPIPGSSIKAAALCPPSKNSIEIRNVRNTDEEDRLRALSVKEARRADLAAHDNKSHTAQRNWLALIILIYVLLKIGRSYLSKIPVIGWLSKIL